MVHLNLHNLRKYDFLPCPWSNWTKTAWPAVCLWGLYGVSVGSTAGWALPFRFTLRGFRVGHQLPAANFIMHHGRGLNNSTKLRAQDLLNQRLFKEQRVDLQYLGLPQLHLRLMVVNCFAGSCAKIQGDYESVWLQSAAKTSGKHPCYYCLMWKLSSTTL